MQHPQALAFSLGGPEALIILAIILLVFGAKKLPALARSIGRSTGEFKKGRIEADLEEEAAKEEKTSDDDDDGESGYSEGGEDRYKK